MICLVIGGAKSGKSMYAQNLSKELENESGNLYYVATMNPYDLEDLKRIENHLKERDGYGFETIEVQRNIGSIVSKIEKKDTLLIDSLTSIVTNEMFYLDEFNENVKSNIINGIKSISNAALNVVMVSDYISSDSIHYDNYTESFRKELGNLNIELAKASDVVIECVFNNIIIHKGRSLLYDKTNIGSLIDR